MENTPHVALRQSSVIAPAVLPLLSHELRTPLTAIKGFAALLLRYHDRLHPGEQREMLDEIGLACERLEQAIVQVVQMSEIIAGQIDFAPVALDLAHLLQEAFIALEPQQPGDSVHATASLSIGGSGPWWVSGDPRHLDQLLKEVLGLAHALSSLDTPIFVTLRPWPDAAITAPMMEEQQWWEVAIRLTGNDIAADQRAYLVHPFSAGASLVVDEMSQAGLTLTHCRLIAALHDGLLWIESHAYHEHTLHLVLPAWS